MSDVPMHDSVLVVEDDPDLLAVLPRILSTAGYVVRTASDGEDGLSKVLDAAPAIAILDVGLPKLSGYELARELRSRGYQFPVLMLTARVSVDDKVSGLDAGADDYLEAVRIRGAARAREGAAAPLDDHGRQLDHARA